MNSLTHAHDSPFIVTLKLDTIAFNRLNELRQQHFPPERNFLAAHVTLFHSLPSNQEAAIRQTLQNCLPTSALPLRFPKLRSLSKGVAVEIDCPDLIRLHQQLAESWQTWLSAQDRQPYRPHVTVQNKVAAEEARHLYDRLSKDWKPLDGQGEGLLLWRYKGGPWEMAGEFSFTENI